MEFYFAPLEGITDMVYRWAHRKHYPGMDRYYAPFVSPTQHHCFTPRELRELNPENNADLSLVPQLLGKNAEDFLWAVRELAEMGYREVNLNLGCPSGTVTAKGKGAGFLAAPDKLDTFLDRVFSMSPLPISIKTRLGMDAPEEFQRILAIYNQYPICQLIIHPRTGKEMYRGDVHLDAFERALEHTVIPVCYNGNLFTADDCCALAEKFPKVSAVMLGRGLVAEPGLIMKMRGEKTDKRTLMRFHDDLCAGYIEVFGSPASALPRMKAIWLYMLPNFENGDAYRKALIKSRRWQDFLQVVEQIAAWDYLPSKV